MMRPVLYQATVDKILDLTKTVNSGVKLSVQDEDECLRLFEDYECWEPFFKVISRKLKAKDVGTLDSYVRLARVQSLYLEDIFAAAETCSQLVKGQQVSFAQFAQEILPTIIEKDDFAAEAAILQAVSTEFSALRDSIACLERLCMLYEKKTHNEAQLAATYEKLLEVDKKNVRALRYFKLAFTQNQDWDNVARLLQDLLKSVKHQQERFRVAQELATVLLYHLDQPVDAINVLETHCAESPLDTSNIQFEAYQRLRKYDSCINILMARLKKEADLINQAIIYFKIGEMFVHLQKTKESIENFEKAALLWPEFLDPIERVIFFASREKDWLRVVHWLEELKRRVKISDNIARISDAVSRVSSGLAGRV